MSWQYSNPLSGALLAAQANSTGQSDLNLGLGTTGLYQPFYSSYDPIFSRYQPRTNFFDRTPASINIFDDIDEFALEVETDNILSARYKIPSSIYKQPAYVPSYFSNTNINNNNALNSNFAESNEDANQADTHLYTNRSNKSNEIDKKSVPKPNQVCSFNVLVY